MRPFAGVLQDGYFAVGMLVEKGTGSRGHAGWEPLVPEEDVSALRHLDFVPVDPDILPPGFFRDRAQLAPAFPDGGVPCLPGRHMQFAVRLMPVAVVIEQADVAVDLLVRRVGVDGVEPEIGGQTVLPNLVDALDLPLGLGGVGEDKRDVLELKPLADAGDAVVLVALECARMIDIDFKRKPMRFKGFAQKVQVGGDDLAAVEGAPCLHAAAIVDHVQQG